MGRHADYHKKNHIWIWHNFMTWSEGITNFIGYNTTSLINRVMYVYNNTKQISPFSVELIVFSMFALKFHLKIDIKEVSFTNSKSGKDLQKTGISFMYYHIICVREK